MILTPDAVLVGYYGCPYFLTITMILKTFWEIESFMKHSYKLMGSMA